MKALGTGSRSGVAQHYDFAPKLTVDWATVGSADFWRIADDFQDQTLQRADALFAALENADLHTLQRVLVQYRVFTVYYISDLALLIAKMRDGRIRSFLADILADELGCGDASKAHPALYDNFLTSIGMEQGDIAGATLAENIRMLDEIRRQLVDGDDAFGVGLRGMGGECVCQVYITLLHKHLLRNPYIKANHEQIDWVFWDLHVGDHDIEHRDQTRNLIHEEIVLGGGESLQQLGVAYELSMNSWEQFWNNIFIAAVESPEKITH